MATGLRRSGFLAGVASLLLIAIALVPLKLVAVKMLPLYNKSGIPGDHRYARWHRARAGEWHITYEVFRDLGIAFAAVLVLI